MHIELYIEVVEEEKELNVLFCRRGKKNYMHIDFSGKIAVEVTLKKYLQCGTIAWVLVASSVFDLSDENKYPLIYQALYSSLTRGDKQ